jgi:TPR repeat protein
LGDALAMAALHYVYARGLVGSADPEKSLEWARLAFDTGTAAGKHVLGRCYLQGLGVEKNALAAWKLIEEAAQQGFPISQLSLADREINARTSPDPVLLSDTEVAQNLSNAAANGSHQASYYLGMLKLPLPGEQGVYGEPTKFHFFVPEEKDAFAALKHLKEGAEAGSGNACHSLFNLLRQGLGGTPAQPEEAKAWLKKGAELGHPLCQGTLGAALLQTHDYLVELFGGLYKADVPEGLRWLELAAAQNDESSLMLLVDVYADGIAGVIRPNPNRARAALEQLVAMGVPNAIAEQAVWYADGRYYPKDDNKAISLISQAIGLNSPLGYYYLGLRVPMRRPFNAAPDDPSYNYHLFLRAQALGEFNSERRIEKLVKLIICLKLMKMEGEKDGIDYIAKYQQALNYINANYLLRMLERGFPESHAQLVGLIDRAEQRGIFSLENFESSEFECLFALPKIPRITKYETAKPRIENPWERFSLESSSRW